MFCTLLHTSSNNPVILNYNTSRSGVILYDRKSCSIIKTNAVFNLSQTVSGILSCEFSNGFTSITQPKNKNFYQPGHGVSFQGQNFECPFTILDLSFAQVDLSNINQ